MSHKERISGYLPEDYEIIKQTQPDGTIVFMHPMGEITGEEIETYDTDLYSLLREFLNPTNFLVDLLGDNDYAEFWFVYDILVNNIFQQLDEVFSFINNSLGLIMVQRVERKQCCYRPRRVVTVSVKPPEEKEVDHG